MEEVDTNKSNLLDSVGAEVPTESSLEDKVSEDPLSDSERQTIIEENSKSGLERLEQEIKSGYRIIEYDDKKYRICFPSMKDDEVLSRYKSKIAMEVLKDKTIILRDEVIDNLKERGIWDDKKEKQESELREKYSDCLSQFFLEKNKKKPNKATITQLNVEKKILSEMINVLTKTKDYFVNLAAESRIDEMVLKQKMVLCIKSDDKNECVWKSLDEFENCNDKGLVNTIISDAIYFWAGLDQSMFDSAPDFN
jgi:hypothetical protein